MNRDRFHELVYREFDKQKRPSDKDKHDYEWLGLLFEEAGEVAECVNKGECPVEELVQVAMIVEAWVLNIKETA